MSKFQEYVTNQAFSLSLSRNMINALLWYNELHSMLDDIPEEKEFANERLTILHQLSGEYHLTNHFVSAVSALRRRGLVEPNSNRPTQAGRLLIPLLHEAGFVLSPQEAANDSRKRKRIAHQN